MHLQDKSAILVKQPWFETGADNRLKADEAQQA